MSNFAQNQPAYKRGNFPSTSVLQDYIFTSLVHWCILKIEVIYMATNRPRYTVSVDNELFQKIEDFRYERRYQTRSQATVELIRLGLASLEKERNEEKQSQDANAADSADA